MCCLRSAKLGTDMIKNIHFRLPELQYTKRFILCSGRSGYIRLGFYRGRISCNEGHKLYQPCRLLISLWCKAKQHQTASQQIDAGQKKDFF